MDPLYEMYQTLDAHLALEGAKLRLDSGAKTLTVEVGNETYVMTREEEPIKLWWEK